MLSGPSRQAGERRESLREKIVSNHRPMICDDCQETTDWVHAVQCDPWGRPTGDVYCENCAEKRWDRHQERAMEET